MDVREYVKFFKCGSMGEIFKLLVVLVDSLYIRENYHKGMVCDGCGLVLGKWGSMGAPNNSAASSSVFCPQVRWPAEEVRCCLQLHSWKPPLSA